MKTRKITPYLYVLPAVLILAVFVYIPIVLNFGYSLYRWSSFSPDMQFVGLEHYQRIFRDEIFWTCLKNNTIYALISLVGQLGVGLVLAAIMENKAFRRSSPFFRTVFFIPSVVSFMVVGLLWYLLFHPTVGPVNDVLAVFGVNTSNLDILGNAETALFGVIFASQWMYFGYMAMLLIVAIQKIPDDLYEAAQIDGASPIQQFFHITVPGIREMILVEGIIIVVGSFKLFDEVYIMTKGGPGYASEVLSTYLYRTAFRSDEMGYASTIAVMLFIITFALSIVQLRMSRSGAAAGSE